jgi:hypothetical protein
LKNFILFSTAIISLFYLSERASAAFHLEPFAGTKFNSQYNGETSGNSGKVGGTVVGARLGFTEMGLSFGFDGRRLSLSYKPDASGSSDKDYTFTQYGVFVGYELPIMLRFWGTYVLSNEGSEKNDSDSKVLSGSGTVFGVGYKALPFISINLEYYSLSNTERETSAGKSDYTTDAKGFILGVSVPLSI